MLSYQHIYHAGNFADVQKHVILAAIAKELCKKPGDITVLDTHAGRGIYDLKSDEADKNKEFQNGITRVLAMDSVGKYITPYLDIVRDYNADGDDLAFYPGSSAIIRRSIRPKDKLFSIERHPGEYKEIKNALGDMPNTAVLQQDGLQYMVDNMPLATRRGFVVVDPSYEIKSDYDDLPRYILNAWKKWPTGVFAIWYPIMPQDRHTHLLSGLYKTGIKDILVSEMKLPQSPQDHYHMSGTGMAIINPPWPESVLKDITAEVLTTMPDGTSGDVFWLNNKPINPDTGLVIL